jgi:hypothetical protein
MSDYCDRVERQIVSRVEAGVPRASRLPAAFGHLYMAAAVLVVIVVVGVFLLAHGTGGGNPAPAANAGVEVTFKAAPGASSTAGALTAEILRERLHAAVPRAQVSSADGRMVVSVAKPRPGDRTQIIALAAPGRLDSYDCEGSVLTPSGKTVASQLRAKDPRRARDQPGQRRDPIR